MERDIVCCVVAVLMNPKDEKARLDGEDARPWRPRLRVLSLPGRGYRTNPYFDAFCDALRDAAVEVVAPRSRATMMFRFDILHIHFPEHYVLDHPLGTALRRGLAFLAYATIAKLLGKKVVWTVHDALPNHSRNGWLLWPHLRYVRALIDAYIFMSPASEARFFAAFPRRDGVAVWHLPHGTFDIAAMVPAQRDALRRELTGGVDCLLVSYIGEIKPYKNVEALAQIPPKDPSERLIKVLVAGRVHPRCDPALVARSLAQLGPERLVRLPEYLSNERMAELMQAVDVVLLPYTWGWNSGAVAFAVSCHARLLCSDLPMFRELAEQLGPPWVYVYDHAAADPAAALRAALFRMARDAVDQAASDRLRAFLAETSFAAGGIQLRDLYAGLLAR